MTKVKLTPQVMQRMWLPENFWPCTLGRIPDYLEHKRNISTYVSNIVSNVKKSRGLLLFGQYSMGKSAIAAICLKAAAASGIIGFWISASDLPMYIIDKVQFDGEQSVLSRCRSVPLLVIDELFIRAKVNYLEAAVEELVRRRVDSKLCTILTTNLAPSELQFKYPPLYAILTEAVTPIKIDGYNFRANPV